MTPYSLLPLICASFVGAGSTTSLKAKIEPQGKSWTFGLGGNSLTVTPPGAQRAVQELELHPSDTPPEHPILETPDLNFDGFKDLRVLAAKHGPGQTIWQYWLFDPKTRRFVPSPELDAALNPRPDTEGKKDTLSVYWNGGSAGRIYWRKTYRWEGSKLVLVEDVEQTAIADRPDDFKKVVRRREKGALLTVEETVVHDPH
jgi:hypothetical protein